jgi:hypothetical protein
MRTEKCRRRIIEILSSASVSCSILCTYHESYTRNVSLHCYASGGYISVLVEGTDNEGVYKMTVIFVSGSSSFLTGIFPVDLHGMLSRELDLGLGSDKVAQWVVLQIKCQYDRNKFASDLELFLIYLFIYIFTTLSFAETELLSTEL